MNEEIVYTLVAYVNNLYFANKDGSIVNYAKAIFTKETDFGMTLEVFRASKDLDIDELVGKVCRPLFDERGRVISLR